MLLVIVLSRVWAGRAAGEPEAVGITPSETATQRLRRRPPARGARIAARSWPTKTIQASLTTETASQSRLTRRPHSITSLSPSTALKGRRRLHRSGGRAAVAIEPVVIAAAAAPQAETVSQLAQAVSSGQQVPVRRTGLREDRSARQMPM